MILGCISIDIRKLITSIPDMNLSIMKTKAINNFYSTKSELINDFKSIVKNATIKYIKSGMTVKCAEEIERFVHEYFF
jgi:hydroxymethylpyrimidine/phosphomethylpyrimidine kinase